MRILIDGITRWSGGYIRHLQGILGPEMIPEEYEVYIYGTSALYNALGKIDSKVIFIRDDKLPKNPIMLRLWRRMHLLELYNILKPDVHFSTSGYVDDIGSNLVKKISIFRNVEPFIPIIAKRLELFRKEKIRLLLLKEYLKDSMRLADGVIFPTEYSKELVIKNKINIKESRVIPYGILDMFFRKPERKKLKARVNILYVSDFNIYKNQWNVVKAVDILRKRTNKEINLELIGRMTRVGAGYTYKVLKELDFPNWIKISQRIRTYGLKEKYHHADIFVFASYAESIGNIFLEAMASGLPIAYSNCRPMVDILGNCGALFDYKDPYSIALSVEALLRDDEYRNKCAIEAYQRALNFRWEKTAKQTYDFIKEIYDRR